MEIRITEMVLNKLSLPVGKVVIDRHLVALRISMSTTSAPNEPCPTRQKNLTY